MIRSLLLLTACSGILGAQGYRDRMGVDVDGPGDGSRSRPFVDHARLFRPCSRLGGSDAAPVDQDGWPTSDASCVMFDVRPIPAWAPPIDDPAQFQPDWSGTWKLSLDGKADIVVSSGGGAVRNLVYDEALNRTTADIEVLKGTGLIILDFRNTGSGFRNLHFVRPGYAARTSQIFTDEFLTSFAPFQVVRYMDWTNTNGNTPSSNPQVQLEWTDRHVPSDATQQAMGRKTGAAWEYAILLANQTGTDLWINIPVAASDDYVRQLAQLIARRLNPSLRIYIEHGNEVWNPLFANSYNFNRNAAKAEVAAGGSNLNADGTADLDALAVRRHLRRLSEAVRIFRDQIPEDGPNARIRGIFAWWTIFPDRYLGALRWFQTNIGAPKDSVYGVAQTHYYNVSGASATAMPEDLLTIMQRSSDGGLRYDDALRQTARSFGLEHVIYEGGPDVGGGSTVNVGNRILANRLPAMKDLVIRDMQTNFFDRGGGLYSYFSHCGSCSRYGCWGATEDIVDRNTPKWQALRQLAGVPAALQVSAIQNAASGTPDLAPGMLVAIRGENLAAAPFVVGDGMIDGTRALATMLGGFQVRIAGMVAAVKAAGPDQALVALPPDLPLGEATIEITSRNGSFSQTVQVSAVAPGLFTRLLGGGTYAEAYFAGTSVAVGPDGAGDGIQSRPALPGDTVELRATGLGPTADPFPANELLGRPYAFGDLSRLRVLVGGVMAEVVAAEAVDAGIYRVTIRIPANVTAGDQEITLAVDDAVSASAVLTIGS